MITIEPILFFIFLVSPHSPKAFAEEAAKGIQTEKDLNEFRSMLTKITVEAALNAELDDHLGFVKHDKAGMENSRNGHTRKSLQTDDGQFDLNTPRDRNGSFEPKLWTSQPFLVTK